MDEKEMRNCLKEEIMNELFPIIARRVYVDLRAEEILEWLRYNLRVSFFLTPALSGFKYFQEIVFEMLRGSDKDQAIKIVASNNQKTVDHVKVQLRHSISVANEQIERIRESEPERLNNLKLDRLPSQPRLIRLIFDECVSSLKLRF